MTDTLTTDASVTRRLLRDPLVHFIGIGLVLFGLDAVLSPGVGGDAVTITQAMADDARAQHQKLWGRQPTPDELKTMLQTLADEEIIYREGLAMGLDREDSVIKRRVRVKYELIAEEADGRAPSDADLAAFLQAQPERFRAPPVLSFTQVLIPVAAGPQDLKARFESMKAALDRGALPESVGQKTMLATRVDRQALDVVARDFGTQFATAITDLPVGAWSGPVPSGYGLHIVRVEARTPAALPPLAEIRHIVEREWEKDRRRAARAARLAELRKRYNVVFEVEP